nr:toll/interleukin-1 receptor domain-containing protein [Nitrosomonas nitrosa]
MFDTDVFISYAHLDNQPLTASAQGWVSEFHEALSKRLGEVLGKPPRIWRDPKLQGNDIFADEITQRFERAAVLVSVITPRYVESDWCRREVTGFWQVTEHTGGPVVGNKARLFKVVKTPADQSQMPGPVQALLGYEFYRLQPGNGRPLEFNRVYGPDAERDFWVRLNDLAYDLADLLKRLEHPGQVPAVDKPSVYLAATTSDLQAQHDAMRRELLRHGYGVLPNSELPLVAGQLEETVKQHLEVATLSVHLIGARYGIVPEGAVDSIATLQARLAAESAHAEGLMRLVWIAPNGRSDDGRQRTFVENLRDDPTPSPGSDLLESSFEDLKALVLTRLQTTERTSSQLNAVTKVDPRVYLICDSRELDTIRPLQKYLFEQRFETILPASEGDETELRIDHDMHLRECEAVLIHYGVGSEPWLRQKLVDLRRISSLGRVAPLRAAAILLVPPSTPSKEHLLTRDALVLRMQGEDLGSVLRPFIAQIGNGWSSA